MRLTIKTICVATALMLVSGCTPPPAPLDISGIQQPHGQEQTANSVVIDETPNEAVEFKSITVGTTMPIEAASRADYYYDVLSGTLTQLAPVWMDDAGVYQPQLTDFETADAQKWTLTVREGFNWQDGTPVTANDIKFTLEYLERGEPGKYLAKYESITVLDDRKIELMLKEPSINMLSDLTTLRIIPEHIFSGITRLADADEQQATIGCGPYKFVRFDKAAGVLEFEANRDYQGGAQPIGRVVVRIYGNRDTMLLALKKGEIDIIYNYAGGLEPAEAFTLMAYSGRKLEIAAIKDSGNPAVLVFNNSDPVWKNADLRRAVALSLDYAKFRELFGSHDCIPSNAGFVPPGSVGYTETPELVRSLEGAKAALAKAGYADASGDGFVEKHGKPLKLELSIRSDKPVYQRYGELVQQNLAEAGIAVELKVSEVAAFRAITEQQHSNAAMLSRFTAFGMAMKGGMGSGYMDARQSTNAQGQVTDPAYAIICDSLRSATTAEQYALAAADCQKYYAEALPAIALYWDSYTQAYAAGLQGFVVDGTFGLLNAQSWMTLTNNIVQ